VSRLVASLPEGDPAVLYGLRRRLAHWMHGPHSLPSHEVQAPVENCGGVRESILIVELGGWRCGGLCVQLEQAGFLARVVHGVAPAIQSCTQQPVSLCIVGGALDVAGCDALHQARPMPVLALIADANSDLAWSLLEAGADDCQASSISQAEVVARVRMLLRHSGGMAKGQ
jgi:DNA-binding response OmpR family regulator